MAAHPEEPTSGGTLAVDIRLLGPVEVWHTGRHVPLPSSKVAGLAAILAMSPGQPVLLETLVDRLWDKPPPRAREDLSSYITRLRRALQQAVRLAGEDEEIVRPEFVSGSYRWNLSRDDVDLLRFRGLITQARNAAADCDDHEARALYRRADEQWHGEALAGLGGAWMSRMRSGLRAERRTAFLERVETELRLGRHAEVLADVYALTGDDPYNEHAVAQLMTALYRCGRHADALACYEQTRQRLRDDLGSDPGDELRNLHGAILRREPSLSVRTHRHEGTVRPTPLPESADASLRGLPRDAPTFVGRIGEMAQLHRLLDAGHEPPDGPVPIVAIDGMAGVGKTSLAVHLAHTLAPTYSDGQLFLDLHGHATLPPLDPATALARLLTTIGVPADRLPATVDERAALWRTRLASRRLLLVLDNAGRPDQVRPLLPGAGRCAVIITSRPRLIGLDNIETLSLDTLPANDAGRLLTRIIDDPIRTDPAAVEDLAHLCGLLPLALQLVGSRLRHRPAWSLADMAHRLNDARDRLREIGVGDDIGIRAAFDLSYRTLPPDQQRLFRLLGQHPTAQLTLRAAAALAAAPLRTVERLLDALVDQHLLDEPERGLYRLHDLLHAYACHLGEDTDTTASDTTPADTTAAAMTRLFAYQLCGTDRADQALFPGQRRLPLPAPGNHAPVAVPEFTDAAAAEEWLNAERPGLLAAIPHAVNHRQHPHAAWLGHLLHQFLETRGHWEEGISALRVSVTAWHDVGRPDGSAHTTAALGRLYLRTSRYPQARGAFEEAARAYRENGDHHGHAEVLDQLGQLHGLQSDYDAASEMFEEALRIQRQIGDQRSEAHTLSHMGIPHWHTGAYGRALEHYRQALDISRRIGDTVGEAAFLNNIGDVLEITGQWDEALTHYETSYGLVRQVGRRQWHGIAKGNIGRVYHRMKRYDDAHTHYRDALTIFQSIGDSRCEADTANNLGALLCDRGQWDEALTRHQAALAIATDIHDPYQQIRAQQGLGHANLRAADYSRALGAFQAALHGARHIGAPYQQAHALDGLARALACLCDIPQARDLWQEAWSIFRRIEVPEADDVRARLDRLGDTDRSDPLPDAPAR